MSEIYLTSDTHWWHKNIISYCDRPFSSVEEMNQKLIENWNSKISPSDIIYHLGDIAFCGTGKLTDILSQLNGKIKHIPGNHDDKKILNICSKFHEIIIESNFSIEYNYLKIYMSHDYRKHYVGENIYHFHGHEHGTDLKNSYNITMDEMKHNFKEFKWFGVKNNAIEVGVDLWDYSPVHIDIVLNKLI